MNETLVRTSDEWTDPSWVRGMFADPRAPVADHDEPIRCLIVDDNEIYAEVLAGTLAREDVQVTGITCTSAEALQHVDALAPNVALVDIALGEESGFDLARLLTTVPCRITIILMSTYLADEFADVIKDDPEISYLQKSAISGTAIRAIRRRHLAACGS